MHNAADNNLMHEGHHRGRPGRTAHGPGAAEEPINKTSRVARRPNAKFANDATSCYDRTMASIASVTSRKFGVPKTVCMVMAKNLEEAKCKFKTQMGVSDEHCQHHKLAPMCGTGQRSSNSPMMWSLISSVLFEAHAEKAHGVHFVSFE